MSTTQFIDELAAGNASGAKDILNDMLSARAFEALEGRKIEIAQNIFNGSQVQEEKEDHHQNGYDHVREPISDEPYLDNARERFNELKKQNPHKKGTQEHKDWHSGASAAYEEHKDILRGN